MAVPTLFASRLPTILGRRGAKKLVAGTRAVRGASAAVCGASAAAVHGANALSTAASHEAPFCLASPPPADPEGKAPTGPWRAAHGRPQMPCRSATSSGRRSTSYPRAACCGDGLMGQTNYTSG